ncbi:choice-of-anchor J domain-containing protein [Ferruginibacter sp.]
MQKTTTRKEFKVFLLRMVLPVLVLSMSLQISFAQQQKSRKTASGKVIKAPATPVANAVRVTGQNSKLGISNGPTDVPAMNKIIATKMAKNPGIPTEKIFSNSLPTSNIVEDVCTYNGGLTASDLTLTNGRFFRDGVPSTCAAPKGVCPGIFNPGTGPYYYDKYTVQNLTCASQCVTVSYIANAGGGDVFGVAYNGSFDPNNLCANYIADGGSSSLSPGATVTYSFTLPANQTVVLVLMAALTSTECPSYTMTVTGLTCTPPPPCQAPTSSVLSQVQIPGPASNLFAEGFDGTIPPAGWPIQNLSNPIGLTNWSQTNSLVFAPQSGVGFASANFNNTAGTGTISDWMFTPAIATMRNGDKFSFYTRTTTGTFPDRLQLWLNTTNTGTNVGTTESSTGDYTTLLVDINPNLTGTGYPTSWTQYTVTMSGLPAAGIPGRLGFRYYVTGGGPTGANSDFIGIDNAVYTTFPLINPNTCTGSTANLKVDMTGGDPSYTYNVTIHPSVGPDFTVLNYTSGNQIPVTPAVTTTYSLVSVIVASNPCCIGTGNSGTPTITVSPTTVAGITVTANPSTPLCAGDPTLLTIIGAPTNGTATAASGPISVAIPDASATGVSTNLNITTVPAGATGTSASVNFNITHTWDGDLTLFLKSPNGQVLNLVNAKGGTGDNFVNTTINSTSTTVIPAAGAPFTGTFAPDGALGAAPPTGFIPTATTFLPLYNTGTANLNGTWSFAARDNAGGDVGTITSWSLAVGWTVPAGPPAGYTFQWSPTTGISSSTGNPIAASPMTTTTYTVLGTAPNGCQTTGAVTIVVNQLPAVTSQPTNLTVCQGSTATFSIVGTGAGISYQWQVSTNNGATYTNIPAGAPYGGVTTNTLTITNVPASFNTYRYRCVVSGTCPPAANSVGAILTVNPLPVITVSPASPICGGIAGTNGTLITASGATTYTWSPATGLYTNAAATTPYVAGTPTATVYAAPAVNTTYTITGTNGTTGCIGTLKIDVNYKPAAPTVNPASVTTCVGFPAVPLTITSSLTPTAFTDTYSSGTVSIPVPDNSAVGAHSDITVPLPATAAITNVRVTINMPHTYCGDMIFNLKAPNGQILALDKYLTGTGNQAGTYPNTGFVNTVVSSAGTAAFSSAASQPITGTFKADMINAAIATVNNPNGYVSAATAWNQLYSTPNGVWTLAMADGGGGDVGTLTSWSISFDYLYGVPASGVWTPATGLYLNATGTPYVAGTAVNTVYAQPATSTTYSVTVTSVGPDATPTFSNTASVSTGDGSPGSPYPSNISVTGLPTTGASVTSVTLNGLSHTWSDDIDILLQSPSGQNVILMSDIGFGNALNNNTFVFNDAGPLLTTGATPSGTYHPTNLVDPNFGVEPDNWPAPGPGTVVQPNPALAMFTGNFNGTWKLFIVDDFGGDTGNLAGGYSISFKYPTVGCVSNATQVPVTVNTPITFPTQPVDAAVCTDKVTSFTTVAAGSVIAHNWKVSTDNGNTWGNVSNGGVYAGAQTGTLTISAPPVSMNGYLYKDSIHTAGCRDSISRIVKLTVNPLPTIILNASPFTKLFPGLRTTVFSTVTPAASTYTWFKDGVAVPNQAASSILVDVSGIGTYTLRVTDVNGCTNNSVNSITITDSVSGRVFVYPNPNNGVFQVRYHSVANNVNLPRGLNVYDARGKRVFAKTYSIAAPYGRMDVDIRNLGTGVYWVEVVDINGNRLAVGRAEVLR